MRSIREDSEDSVLRRSPLWQHVGAEEFPHLLPEGPVEDIAESTTLAAVLGEEEHAAEKSRLTQTRIG